MLVVVDSSQSAKEKQIEDAAYVTKLLCSEVDANRPLTAVAVALQLSRRKLHMAANIWCCTMCVGNERPADLFEFIITKYINF